MKEQNHKRLKNMERMLLPMLCLLMMAVGCKNKNQTPTEPESDSTAVTEKAELTTKKDEPPRPLFLYHLSTDYMTMVYWDEELQAELSSRAKDYTKIVMEDDQLKDIKFTGEVLTNPDGEKLFVGELHSRPTLPSPGLNYAFVSPENKKDWWGMSAIVTDSYLQTRKLLKRELLSPFDIGKPFPQSVVKQLEKEYGMTAKWSEMAYRLGNRYTYGVVQFKPKNKKVIALEVVTDGDKTYSVAEEGYYESDQDYGWNVDDEGTYIVSSVCAAFEGPDGLELCFNHGAPESQTVGMMFIRDGKLVKEEYACYHSLIDEQAPLWKKDLAEMRKLYLADDPHENKDYKLTKYMPIDIDNDHYDEIWLRDKDGEHGALFTNKNGKVELIGVETEKLKVSFLQTQKGKGYVRIAGSAGGPSIYTQLFAIKNSQVVERFNKLEIAGELSEATLNGKTLSHAYATKYTSALPVSREPYLYFINIEEE